MGDVCILFLLSSETLRLVLAQTFEGRARALELVLDFPVEPRAHVFRALGWLLKIGPLCVVDVPVPIMSPISASQPSEGI